MIRRGLLAAPIFAEHQSIFRGGLLAADLP